MKYDVSMLLPFHKESEEKVSVEETRNELLEMLEKDLSKER